MLFLVLSLVPTCTVTSFGTAAELLAEEPVVDELLAVDVLLSLLHAANDATTATAMMTARILLTPGCSLVRGRALIIAHSGAPALHLLLAVKVDAAGADGSRIRRF